MTQIKFTNLSVINIEPSDLSSKMNKDKIINKFSMCEIRVSLI